MGLFIDPPFGICQPFVQLRPPPTSGDILHRDGDSPFLADEYHQSFAPGDAGVKQVPLQHGVVLGQNGDDDGGVFGALTFVNGRGVCRHQVSSSPNP
jgi:hypothetical protein